jgi:uncharacterized protein YcfL
MNKLTLAGLITSLALVGGCADPVKAPYAARPDTIGAAAYPQIAIDASAEPYVGVTYQRIVVDAPTGDKPLAVRVPVRSIADVRFAIQYEWRWFDAQGREVGRSGTQFQNMDPRMEQQLAGNALTSSATNWRLEIRVTR